MHSLIKAPADLGTCIRSASSCPVVKLTAASSPAAAILSGRRYGCHGCGYMMTDSGCPAASWSSEPSRAGPAGVHDHMAHAAAMLQQAAPD